MVKHEGAFVAVGVLGPFKSPTHNREVAMRRHTVSGPPIGSIAERQEVLDFWAEHSMLPDGELIAMQAINKAYKRMLDEDVRFVIDIPTFQRTCLA